MAVYAQASSPEEIRHPTPPSISVLYDNPHQMRGHVVLLGITSRTSELIIILMRTQKQLTIPSATKNPTRNRCHSGEIHWNEAI